MPFPPSLTYFLSLYFFFFELHPPSRSLVNLHAFQNSFGYRDTVLFYYFRKLIPGNCAMAVITRSPAPLAANFWRLVASYVAAFCFFFLFSAAEHRMRAANKVWKNRCELCSKSKFQSFFPPGFSSQVYPFPLNAYCTALICSLFTSTLSCSCF